MPVVSLGYCSLVWSLPLYPNRSAIIRIGDTLERRTGRKIATRDIYRDWVRSSHDYFVKASGLHWQVFMLLTPLPGTARVWGLPFLTLLCPSERYARERGRPHRRLTDRARQGLLQIA